MLRSGGSAAAATRTKVAPAPGSRRNKLQYGTCKLVYNDTRTVQSIYGAIQSYAGFDRPEWLD
jgi:hypothetical protein